MKTIRIRDPGWKKVGSGIRNTGLKIIVFYLFLKINTTNFLGKTESILFVNIHGTLTSLYLPLLPGSYALINIKGMVDALS
jgi:hypothetical protein